MQKKKNPNNRVKELKKKYGPKYDYSFLEYDNLQREFYNMVMKPREKRAQEGKK